ncbi:MAG: hypothetical protein AB1485_06585 [Candidatus Thermoplasmatota archaeon]
MVNIRDETLEKLRLARRHIKEGMSVNKALKKAKLSKYTYHVYYWLVHDDSLWKEYTKQNESLGIKSWLDYLVDKALKDGEGRRLLERIIDAGKRYLRGQAEKSRT